MKTLLLTVWGLLCLAQSVDSSDWTKYGNCSLYTPPDDRTFLYCNGHLDWGGLGIMPRIIYACSENHTGIMLRTGIYQLWEDGFHPWKNNEDRYFSKYGSFHFFGYRSHDLIEIPVKFFFENTLILFENSESNEPPAPSIGIWGWDQNEQWAMTHHSFDYAVFSNLKSATTIHFHIGSAASAIDLDDQFDKALARLQIPLCQTLKTLTMNLEQAIQTLRYIVSICLALILLLIGLFLWIAARTTESEKDIAGLLLESGKSSERILEILTSGPE